LSFGANAERPNIVFILADDLGYGELGCYGQKEIRTPNIDRLAAEGLRFTDCYAGSTVCAPSRCALLTGQHTGHCRVRGNARVPLEPDDVTIGKLLKSAGYETALVGKWGLGEPDSTGIPNRQGFDYFYGYLNQVHAHNYYPDYLWRNEDRVMLSNVVSGGVASKRVEYSPDLFRQEALKWLEGRGKNPFFLYLAVTIPHANNEAKQQGMEVPSDEPYSDRNWPPAQKNHAAMITRLDGDVGALMAKLKELGIDDNTIVFFSSDNGPHREGGGDPEFFQSSGPLQGYKRSLHDGGIRVPMIARWPGRIAEGTTTSHVCAFWDVLPTLADLAGAKTPEGVDGISFAPTLLENGKGASAQKQHDYLYWEFHETGFQQAVRSERWKAIRNSSDGPLQLYDLQTDLGERHDVAAQHPDVVARMTEYLDSARTDSPHWPIEKKAKTRKKR
jgi:arylsulfatase A-like enzyme